VVCSSTVAIHAALNTGAAECPEVPSRRRILVVDDDHEICAVLLDLLTDEGYDVRTASSGAAALAALLLWQPELIVLDLHMADLDGWAFRYQQHSAFPDIPVLVLTADHQAQDQTEQLAAPVLLKPFELDDLLGAIEQHLTLTER
jgi:CheY-like chemotaxis protein